MTSFTSLPSWILEYLGFRSSYPPLTDFGASISEIQWEKALHEMDSGGMVFHFLSKMTVRGDLKLLPPRIQERLFRNLRDQSQRQTVICKEFLELNRLLKQEGVRYLCLKGLTSYPEFIEDPLYRVQYDFDFFVYEDDLRKAGTQFRALGFEPLASKPNAHTHHLPTMIKRNGWEWRGNHYDPGIPCSVELHFRIWDGEFESISASQSPDRWQTPTSSEIHGVPVPVLGKSEAFLFAIQHAMRHLLGNDLRLSHLYELAFFLNRNAERSAFWKELLGRVKDFPEGSRNMAIILQLARHCFQPHCSPHLEELFAGHLTQTSKLWIQRFGRREALSSFRKSKSGLLLQMDCQGKSISGWSIAWKRLFPHRLPLISFGTQVPENEKTPWQKYRERLSLLRHLWIRSLFHLGSLLNFLWQYPIWKITLSWNQLRLNHPRIRG
ncbi:MAG: nucleotidyltransferase family protein [Terriglobia bacterium]